MELVWNFVYWAFSEISGVFDGRWLEATIALSALGVSLWSARQSARHAGLSVVPALSVWANYPRDKNKDCGLQLINKGFGPAVFQEMRIFYDGEEMKGFQFEAFKVALERAFGKDLEKCYQVAASVKGHAIGVNEEMPLARFSIAQSLVDQGSEEIGERIARLSLTVKYRDIYRRKWIFVVERFTGYTLRVNSPSYAFWYRFRFNHLI